MKRKLVKFVSGAVAVTMVLVLFAGCKPSDKKQDSDGGGAKEIVFWNIGTESLDKEMHNKAIGLYHDKTSSDYTVISVPVQNDTYKEKLVIAMSSGECPDMYVSWSGGPMNEYIKSGYAQPITELFEKSELPKRLMDAAVAQATYKDDIYAVPFSNVALSGVYYNKEIFEKYNLEVPETISELEKVCDTLLENNITPFALANAPKWTGSMYFMNLAARKGGLEPFTAAVDGSGTFEDESFLYAGDKIIEWSKKGYFPEGVNSLSEDDGQSRQLMYQETAAMNVIGSWFTTTVKQDSEEFYEKLGWFPFPKVDGSEADPSFVIGTIGDNFISFNCKEDKLKAAFECATMFSEPELIDFMIEIGKVPPIKGIEERISEPISKQIITAANEASSTQLWYDQYLPPAVAQVHLDTSQELFGQTMTSKDAAAKFQKAMEAYIKDTKE